MERKTAHQRVARSLIILLDTTNRPILPQSIALRLSRAPKRSSDTRRARMVLRTIEPELGHEPRPKRRRDGEDMRDGAFRSPIRICHRLRWFPRGPSGSRVQKTLLSYGLNHNLTGSMGDNAREGGAIGDAAVSAKALHPVTPCHTHSETAASLIASHFRVVMRARLHRVVLPAWHEREKPGRRSCICARNLVIRTPEPNHKK